MQIFIETQLRPGSWSYRPRPTAAIQSPRSIAGESQPIYALPQKPAAMEQSASPLAEKTRSNHRFNTAANSAGSIWRPVISSMETVRRCSIHASSGRYAMSQSKGQSVMPIRVPATNKTPDCRLLCANPTSLRPSLCVHDLPWRQAAKTGPVHCAEASCIMACAQVLRGQDTGQHTKLLEYRQMQQSQPSVAVEQAIADPGMPMRQNDRSTDQPWAGQNCTAPRLTLHEFGASIESSLDFPTKGVLGTPQHNGGRLVGPDTTTRACT